MQTFTWSEALSELAVSQKTLRRYKDNFPEYFPPGSPTFTSNQLRILQAIKDSRPSNAHRIRNPATIQAAKKAADQHESWQPVISPHMPPAKGVQISDLQVGAAQPSVDKYILIATLDDDTALVSVKTNGSWESTERSIDSLRDRYHALRAYFRQRGES